MKAIPYQQGILGGLIIATLAMMGVGVYALATAPYTGLRLVFGDEEGLGRLDALPPNSRGHPPPAGRPVKIEDITLEQQDFLRFPEFFFPAQESGWWQKQQALYDIARGKKFLSVEFFHQGNGSPLIIPVAVRAIPLLELIRRIGLVYLVALIFLFLAIHLFAKRSSFPHQLCAFFAAFNALYYVSAAPVAYRDIALPPGLFKILINGVYIGAGGLITLVHLSLVFPQSKAFLRGRPRYIFALYLYFFTSVLLYLAEVTAFGTTFPFLFFWTLIMVGAFLHSWLSAKSPLPREQIRLAVVLPAIIGLVFILFLLLPAFLGLPVMDFSYFALFSLTLPFALCFGIDNLNLYLQNLKAETERLKIRDAIHDDLGHNLTYIVRAADVACHCLPYDLQTAEQNIRHIGSLARDCVEQVRNFFQVVINLDYNTWEELVGYFKELGERYLTRNDINLEWVYQPADNLFWQPDFIQKFNMYKIFKETINNILKHANAQTVKVSFTINNSKLEIRIEDDGVGFDPEEVLKKKTYGFNLLYKRAQEMGGKITFDSQKGKGSSIHLIVPFGG